MNDLFRRLTFLAAASLLLSLPAVAKSDDNNGKANGHDKGDDDHGSDKDKDEDKDDCPCFTEQDLKKMFDSGDQCYDYTATSTYGNGTFLAYYDGQGAEAGVADYYYAPVPFCAAVNLTTFVGPFVAPITDEQYEDCAEIVLEVADDLGLTCSETPPPA